MTRQIKLLPGEAPVNYAPNVKLENGMQCIPQHYLEYCHTLDTVEEILNDIECDHRYLIFATEEQGQLLLQVGIVGPDNFKHSDKDKIVYGRKWRIEPSLPSSEIIQTAYLALLKAREHEIRERLTLSLNNKVTTPFNNHHDLPLMAQNSALLLTHNDRSFTKSIEEQIHYVEYDHAQIEIHSNTLVAPETWLLQLTFLPSENSILKEVQEGLRINLLLNKQCFNHFLHKLMDQLLLVSNQWIANNFRYKEFARFSEEVSIPAIGNLSMATREPTKDELAQLAHTQLNYSVDENRRPILSDSDYANKLMHNIDEFGDIDGFKPSQIDEGQSD